MSQKDEKLIAKIRALLAKGHGTDNAAESEIFLEKARQLMYENNLELGDLADKSNPMGVEALRFPYKPTFYRMIASEFARYVGAVSVEVNLHPFLDSNNRIEYCRGLYFFGRKSARVMCIQMIPYLWHSVVWHAKDFRKRNPGMTAAEAKRQIGEALVVRLYNMTKKSPAKAATDWLPVPIDEADAAARDAFKNLQQATDQISGYSGEAERIAAGISLNDQVASEAKVDSVKRIS